MTQFVNLPTIQPYARCDRRVSRDQQHLRCGIRPQLRRRGQRDHQVGHQSVARRCLRVLPQYALNAQGYFNTVKPQENQNQFGGTFGGPLRKDRTFFFTSYEGRRVRQGVSGQTVIVPTPQERTGDFSADTPFQGGISDAFTSKPWTDVRIVIRTWGFAGRRSTARI
jgi:hypothetical protein